MTTITKATLGDKAVLFVRDVLRENLTDTQSPIRSGSAWIFKSEPEKLEVDYPFVVIESSSISEDNLSFARTKGTPPKITFNVIIWANKISDRDTISDEIISILKNKSSTDGTDTILSKHLNYLSFISSTEDIHVSNTPDIIRRKRITIDFSYGGA